MEKTNIVLCGFMGCGKSTIGKKLQKMTGREFVDMDNYIEKKAGITVKEIFAQYGEEHFRDLEYQAAKELSENKNMIISAGGGTLLFKRNSNVLKNSCTVILLNVSLSTLKYRLKNDTKRPLLQRPDKNEAMAKMFAERMPIYRSVSDFTVRGAKSPVNVCKDICKLCNIPIKSENSKAKQHKQ